MRRAGVLQHFLTCAALALFLWPAAAARVEAQGDAPAETPPAILIADAVEILPNNVLEARGNVEAFQGQTRLRAERIRYDGRTGTLEISGPIVIEDGASIVVLADEGRLSRDLRDGLLRGARIVLNDQLQLAAVQMGRVGGRYSQLYKTAVTSCQICNGDPRPPLWQIRAQSVVHDAEARQLYFDGAQLLIRSTPVLYLPRLRLPDPTLERASGFLIPSVQTTSQLGTGVKIPYFLRIGDHRDLTLTPYVSSSTRTLEFRYRQAFVSGRLTFLGAITSDDLREGETRGYLFGDGAFDLRNDWSLRFELRTTSDDAYLQEYNYSDDDRLFSYVTVDRTERNTYRGFSLTNVRTLREGEDTSTLPSYVLDGIYDRRFYPRALGGELRLETAGHVHFRESDLDVDGPDPDTIVDGRDVLRVNVEADWRRSYLWRGLETQVMFGVAGDAFRTAQDASLPSSDSEIAPSAALTFRYPLKKVAASGGATHFLEPLFQVGWIGGDGLNVANEESTLVEFDEGNLLSLSRFPAPDRRERGTVLAYGVNWSRVSSDGWTARLTLGQIHRVEESVDLSATSGLDGSVSDVLIAGQLALPNGFSMTARALVDDDLDVAKAEFRTALANARFDLLGTYVWIVEDPAEDRVGPVSEISIDGGYRLNDVWTARLDWRYDFDEGRAVRTGLGLSYTNECVRMSFSVNRRFTTTRSVEPQTSLGFTVSLRGFSTSPGTPKYTRACGKNAL